MGDSRRYYTVPRRGPLIRIGPKTPSTKKPALYLADLAQIYIWQIKNLRRRSFLFLVCQHIFLSFSHCQLWGQPSIYSPPPRPLDGWRQELWKCENYTSYLTKDWGYWDIKMLIMDVYRSRGQD